MEESQVGHEKILAVDDDPMNLAIMEELLGDEYDLAAASDGEEALEVAERIRPDLVLLDIMMPGIDGYETCRRLRQRESLRHTKVVLVSAKAMLAERLKGYEAGADDYITKPFDHAELTAKIRVFLRLKFMEEMDVLKTEFLTLVSHETRTPLTQFVLMAELLEGDDPPGREERAQIVSMIRDTTNRLQRLFDRGLQYCTLRAGRGEFRRESFEASEALRHAARQSVETGDPSRLSLCTTGSARMESDPEKVQLAMRLLLESALVRCLPEGIVRADLSTDGEAVLLEVRCPIAECDPAALRVLLEPFRTPSLDHHTSFGALDLPLAAEILRQMQGEISLRLSGKNQLVVRARFPRVIPATAPRAEAEEPEERLAA